MKKHANIPIFIPHLGCPHTCVFCNQRYISGQERFCLDGVREQIDRALATLGDRDAELAFFGGSFTGLDRSLMLALLEIGNTYRLRGAVSGIRVSTRPDYVDEERLALLRAYGVTTVELGLQSLCDHVLAAAQRGHTAQQADAACRAVRGAGFSLVGQMMVGLPASRSEDERYTARRMAELGVHACRVYPTVTFLETKLYDMAMSGAYEIPSEEDFVKRTADVLEIMEQNGIPCIRVGLCASEALSDSNRVLGGANQSAIGEMAMSEVYYRRLCREIEQRRIPRGASLEICVAKGAVSRAVGHRACNKKRIIEKYGINRVKILEKEEIIGYNIIIDYIV